MGAPKTAPLREQVISEVTVAPGWNLIDATALVDALIAEVAATPAPLDELRAAVDEAITYGVWTEAGDRAGDGFFIGKKWMERIFAALDNAQEADHE